MNEIDFSKLSDPIPIEHVDFRVGLISASGWMTALAYKSARIDMDRLDDVCGPENWQRDHREHKGNLFCGVAIKSDNDWVWKWDVGNESNMDKQKGESSDSFKRACVNWGLGRDLYSYPLLLIQLKPNEFKKIKNAKGKEVGQATWDLKLKEWVWTKSDNGDIKAVDEKGELRYSFKDGKGYGSLKKPKKSTPTDLDIATEAIKGCKTLDDLKQTWSDYKQFQSVFSFQQAKENSKKRLS